MLVVIRMFNILIYKIFITLGLSMLSTCFVGVLTAGNNKIQSILSFIVTIQFIIFVLSGLYMVWYL